MFIKKIEIGDENFQPGAPANERNVYNKLLHFGKKINKKQKGINIMSVNSFKFSFCFSFLFSKKCLD